MPGVHRCTCGQRGIDGAPLGCRHEDAADDERGVPHAPPVRPRCTAVFEQGVCCLLTGGHPGPHRAVAAGAWTVWGPRVVAS